MSEFGLFTSMSFWPPARGAQALAEPHALGDDEPLWSKALTVARSAADTVQETLPRVLEVANDNAKIVRDATPAVVEGLKYGAEVTAEVAVELAEDVVRAAPEATLATALAGPLVGALVILGEIAFRDESMFRSHAGHAVEHTTTTYTPLGRDPAHPTFDTYVPFSSDDTRAAPLEFDPKQLDASRRHNVAVIDPRLKRPDSQRPGILDTTRVLPPLRALPPDTARASASTHDVGSTANGQPANDVPQKFQRKPLPPELARYLRSVKLELQPTPPALDPELTQNGALTLFHAIGRGGHDLAKGKVDWKKHVPDVVVAHANYWIKDGKLLIFRVPEGGRFSYVRTGLLDNTSNSIQYGSFDGFSHIDGEGFTPEKESDSFINDALMKLARTLLNDPDTPPDMRRRAERLYTSGNPRNRGMTINPRMWGSLTALPDALVPDPFLQPPVGMYVPRSSYSVGEPKQLSQCFVPHMRVRLAACADIWIDHGNGDVTEGGFELHDIPAAVEAGVLMPGPYIEVQPKVWRADPMGPANDSWHNPFAQPLEHELKLRPKHPMSGK